MSRKRKMPSRASIFKYWKDKLYHAKDDNTCFKCGVFSIFDDSIIVDRAHILPVCNGGSDELDNLHLLCKNCHRDSESYSGKEYNLWFLSKNKEQFSKALFVLWNRNEIENKLLDIYFNKVKDDYIRNSSLEMYTLHLESYLKDCKELIQSSKITKL